MSLGLASLRNVLTLMVGRQEEHSACRKLDVGSLLVTTWLELRRSETSSCHHHFRYP